MNEDRKLTYIALGLYAVAFAILFGAWYGLLSWWPPKDPEQGKTMINWIINALMLLGGHVLTILPSSFSTSVQASASLVPPAQAGRTLWVYPLFLAFVAGLALMLGGCTTTTGAMYAGLTTQAEAGIKVFDDNTLATVKTVLCAQPYSAIQRHPEIQPGVLALCGPMANISSLDANQLATLMSVMQTAGFKLQAAPSAAAASGAK